MLPAIKLENKYEFLFKGHHVTHYPAGKIPHINNGSSYNVTVRETTALSHVTHDQAAKNITQGEYYIFKPRQKKGKGLENERYTYVIADPADSLAPNADTKCYRQDGVLFPGSYIWWSPSCENPDSSVFGNNKYTISLTKLLQCYQEAIKDEDSNVLPNIHFRCGGTLRYNRQACKVIIVCPTECPDLDKDIESFPPFDLGGIGLGDLTSREIKPKLRYDEVPSTDLVIYAFAFYFPDDSYELKIPKDNVTFSKVTHGKYCVGKQRNPYTGSYVCPNSIQHATQREEVTIVGNTVPEIITQKEGSDTLEENTKLNTEEQETTQQSIKRKRSPIDDNETDNDLSSLMKQKVPAIEKEEELTNYEKQNEQMIESEEKQDIKLSTAEI